MECYFYSKTTGQREDGLLDALLSFSIPSVGITFRTKFKGSAHECEYAALLTLLEFVELNPQVFQDKTVEIYGDSFNVVNQINRKMYCAKDLEPFMNMALMFKKKFTYTLNWIPKRENPAQNGIRLE